MRLIISLQLISFVIAEVASGVQGAPTISVQALTAVTAVQYSWNVTTDTYPGGLNLKVGNDVGALVVSSNYTRNVVGTVGVVSGTITIFNPGDSDLQLSVVQAVLQQPAAGTAPVRVIAVCPRGHHDYIYVIAGQTLACPFIGLLSNKSQAAVTVQAHAAVVESGQLTSLPFSTSFVSHTVTVDDPTSLLLGRCAVTSDTFISGHLFLTPGAVASGMKMNSLGSASAVCETISSLYRVTFGPYASEDTPCGAYQVMNVARANPLGGSQPPYMASNLVMLSITGCPAPSTAAAEQTSPAAAAAAAAAPQSEPAPGHTTGFNHPPPADPIINSLSVSPMTPSATAHWNPYNGGSSTPGDTSASETGTLPSAAMPAPMLEPAADQFSQAPDDEYYYTYEYEAQIPSTAMRRSSHRRLMADGSTGEPGVAVGVSRLHGAVPAVGGQARVSLLQLQHRQLKASDADAYTADSHQHTQRESLSQHQHQQIKDASTRQSAAVAIRTDGLQSQMQEAAVTPNPQLHAPPTMLQQMSQGVWNSAHMELLQQFGSSGLTGVPTSGLSPDATTESAVNSTHLGLQQWELAGDTAEPMSGVSLTKHSNGQQQAQLKQRPKMLHVTDSSDPMKHARQKSWTQAEQPLQIMPNRRRVLLSRHLQQNSSASGPQFIAASTFYGPATTTADDAPSIAFNAMQVGFSVMAFSWQPVVTVTPAAVTLQIGETAHLNYTVQATKTEVPRRTILRGSLTITNPRASALKLVEVAVEAPAVGKLSWTYAAASCGQGGTLASLLNSVITVPAQGQITCTFSVSYPNAAPDNSVLFARAVTDTGQQLVSDGFGFVRPATEVPAAQAVKLGACALLSDTFLTSADSAAILTPSAVPASGTKAPAAAVGAVTDGEHGVLLCDSASYQYTVKLGPYTGGQCGQFMVLSHIRLHPVNSSILLTDSATASVPVLVTGCEAISSTAAAFPLAAAAVGLSTQSTDAAARMAPLTVLLQTEPYTNTTSYSWNVTSTPTATTLNMHYDQTVAAAFMVQYKRTQIPASPTLRGTVIIQNPNLLDAMMLAQVQVELYQLGKSGPVRRVWADCPRDMSGNVVVPGQLLGAGHLVCSWNMQLKDFGPRTSALFSSGDAKLMAVAVTTSGLEYISQAQPLNSVARDDSAKTATAGACVALSNTFQAVGLAGVVLLQPSSSDTGKALLPGSNGGGRAADVVCNSLSVSYGVVYGPFSRHQCGTHRTINLAVASPTSGTSPLASAASTIIINVNGCPGASAFLELLGLQLQQLQAVHWNVTGSAAEAGAAGTLRATVGQSLDVPFKLRYTATAGEKQRQLVGGIQVSSTGQTAVVITQLLVEVVPLSMLNTTAAPLVTWTASCPKVSSVGHVMVSSGSSTTCSFQGVVPKDVVGPALVIARLQFSNGHQAASPAVQFDFSQQTVATVTRTPCALVSDHFLVGNGLLQPSKSTRPAAVAGPNKVCHSQTVSFVASVGPFTAKQCAQVLTVINLSRVSPIPATAIEPPVSFATIVRLIVDRGCPGEAT